MTEPPPALPERPGWSRNQKVLIAGAALGVLGILAVLVGSLLALRSLGAELRASDDATEQFVAVMRESGQVEAAILRHDTISHPEVAEQLAVLSRHISVLRVDNVAARDDLRTAGLRGRVLAAHKVLTVGVQAGRTPGAAADLAGAVEIAAKYGADIVESRRRAMLVQQVDTARWVTLGTIGAVAGLLLVVAGLLLSVRRRSLRAYEEAYALALGRARELEASNLELSRANETKQRFLSMVSHELRTPLTVIRGFAETLARHGMTLGAEQRDELAGSIVRHSLRQQRMVEDLLVLARHTDHQPRAAPVAIAMGALARDVARDVARVAPQDTSIEVLPGPAAAAWADPDHLEQVLENLLTNAVKYGGPHVEVSWARTATQVVLVVEDDGPGVPQEFVPALFDPFTQADDGDTRSSSGVGLGLTITQLLVETNGGTIRHRHRDGGGARFEVTLPHAPEQAQVAARPAQPSPAGSA